MFFRCSSKLRPSKSGAAAKWRCNSSSADQPGSAISLSATWVTGAGASQATYTFDPYGKLVASTGSATNPFLFARLAWAQARVTLVDGEECLPGVSEDVPLQ